MARNLTWEIPLKAKGLFGKVIAQDDSKFGTPPLWKREEGFKTLIYIILEQQVSLASARAAYEKLLKKIKSITPVNFLKLSDAEL
ncbi:hypothetical protein ACFL0H_16045, partial [Thermodesulfobacteriota bacterium]